MTAAGIGIVGALLRAVPARDILPEPFDIFDHAGNLNGSAPAGYLTGLFVGSAYLDRSNPDLSPEQQKRRALGAMAAGGLVVGAVVNYISESKFGMSLTHIGDTGDPIDFGYGVATSVATATALHSFESQSGERY